ncbi:MAG: addiction module protein [Bryobacteraceae bacterium]
MAKDAGHLLQDALALPPEARAALADSLLESIDTEVDEDAESRWREETRRRMAELDSGAVRAISWSEIETRLRKRLNE